MTSWGVVGLLRPSKLTNNASSISERGDRVVSPLSSRYLPVLPGFYAAIRNNVLGLKSDSSIDESKSIVGYTIVSIR